MTAKTKLSAFPAHNGIDILYSFKLGRHRHHDTHVKIFFPADNRIICPAECNVVRIIGKFRTECCKLLLLMVICHICIIGKHNIPETPAFRCNPHKKRCFPDKRCDFL